MRAGVAALRDLPPVAAPRQDALRALQNTLKQAEKRGGAACLLMLRLEDFEALLAESFELHMPDEGSVVRGKVLAIDNGQALIDIGFKEIDSAVSDYIKNKPQSRAHVFIMAAYLGQEKAEPMY